MNRIQCPLCHFGCTNLFLQNQLLEHLGSEEHRKTVVKYICSENIKSEDALINLTAIPSENDESATSAAILVDNYRRLMERLTNVIVETNGQANLMHAASASNDSSNLDRIYVGTESPSRALIEQMDRDLNHENDLASHQAEVLLNEALMNNLSNSIAASSTDGSTNQHMGQNQGSTLANEQQSIALFHKYYHTMLEIELNSKSVSTDGCLIWHIDKIFKKIDDAIYERELFINSSLFETAMHGHRFWIRLSLNGSTDRRFISLHVHLDFRVTTSFRGTIKLVLVDQSSQKPFEHQIKDCSGEITDNNRYLGFDEFIDKNLIHKEGNRYVLDDSICLIAYIPQTNEQKFANHSENVRDALMAIQQS